MNDPRNLIDQKEFDRFVDGELSPSEQHELLMRLDSGADDWSRLALAFVEDQAWRLEFKQLRDRIDHSSCRASQLLQKRTSTATPLVLLATVLLAVVLGYVAGLVQPYGVQTVNDRPQPNLQHISEEAANQELERGVPESSIESLRFVIDDQAANQSFDLPLVEAEDLDPSWLEGSQPILPTHIRQLFERTGHQVHENRHFYPYRLQDGREIIIPVDNVEVRFVGHKAFQ